VFSLAIAAARGAEVQVPTLEVDQTDLDALIAQASITRKGEPLQVGLQLKIAARPTSEGVWETVDAGRRWSVVVQSPGARWLVLGFGIFRLPAGAELQLTSLRTHRVHGPYTTREERAHGQFWSPPIEGDRVLIELFWPKSLDPQEPDLMLNLVSHGFRAIGPIGKDPSPRVGACEIDINCPLGANWQDEKRGVVALLSGGSAYCTGSLIATTARNCAPYVLTAAHCLNSTGEANSTDYLFNYEKPACNSGTAPTDDVVFSSTLRATWSTSDVTLVEMGTTAPEAFNVYYNGWNRGTAASTHSIGIHHPDGAEKKISEDTDAAIDGQSSGWGPTHWRVVDWEQAATEPGSSGSPLFDQNSRIVGQLHGGDSSCSRNTWDEYGKFDRSWTGGGTAASRLSDWLDPGNTGSVAQDGHDYTFCLGPRADLQYTTHTVDDSAGNADGYADPGEDLLVRVTLANAGTSTATQVSGHLTSTSASLSITDDNAVWPDIPQSASRESAAPHFRVRIADNAACGISLPLDLTSFAAESPGSWSSSFALIPGTPSVTTVFDDAVEAGPGNWNSQSLQGTNAFAITAQDSHSPTQAWFVPNVIQRTDTVLLMQVLSNLRPGAELRFWHRYRTENFADGGVLEYSADGGAWTDAAALIREGGYDAKIRSTASTNLAGRDAWAGDSAGWKRVVVDLASLVGRSVQLRWRFATDNKVNVAGWGIDDITVTGTDYTCHPVVVRPGEVSDPNTAAAPLRIAKSAGQYQLDWSAPISGGSASRYLLYRFPLPMTPQTSAQCEADLGTGTSAVLATLSGQSGFVTVARNAAGEGSYGRTSNGVERTPATSGNACP
jgi:hypothetical protein